MRYIIIGGVAGGASAAARLRRLNEKATIILFEKGDFISYANCGLPYYIGDVIKERNKLFVQTAASFQTRFNIDTRVSTEVVSIDTTSKTIQAKNVKTGELYTESYDKLILSPGADPIKPPLPGIDSKGIFTLRNVPDTDRIKQYITNTKAKKAVIVGAGFIGLEMAENLNHLGMEVDIIELGEQILAPVDYPIAAKAQQYLRGNGIKLHLQKSVTGFETIGEQLTVLLNDGNSIKADIVILSIGVRPDTKLAADAGLALGPSKGIAVNEFLQTSNADIYAVGDAIEFINPITGQSIPTYLAGPANKQGRICANNVVEGNKYKYKGAINTAIVKLFDLTIATAGMASKHLLKAGIEHRISTTHSGSHAGYYPGAKQMTIQINFSPKDGKLLGAQAIGFDGVDKRIDVIAYVIKTGGTIYDLAEFEHAYAPPFSSAKDPINMAGFVADNIISEKLKVFYWDEVTRLPENHQLVDVRTIQEFEKGKISNAINIPVDEIRDRLQELDKSKPIYIYCEAGLRGYLAHRTLRQSGFENVFNLSGGYNTWKSCQEEKSALS